MLFSLSQACMIVNELNFESICSFEFELKAGKGWTERTSSYILYLSTWI
jgi:hypothetical protein